MPDEYDDEDYDERDSSDDSECLFNEEEYERLKASLNDGSPLSEKDIERLAIMLYERCIEHCREDVELDNASAELDMLFACFKALKSSNIVRKSFFVSVFIFIDTAGDMSYFELTSRYLSLMRELLAEDRSDSGLYHTWAYAMVRTIENTLNGRSDQSVSGAEILYNELEAQMHPSENDSIIIGILAWAKQLFIYEFVNQHNIQEYEARLKDLESFQLLYRDNAWVAVEYATACYHCFKDYLENSLYVKAYNWLLPIIEWQLIVYRDPYHRTLMDFMDSEEDYALINYPRRPLDSCFTSALSEVAAYDTEKSILENVLAHYGRLLATPHPPDTEYMYRSLRRQMLSNLSTLYGDAKDWAKTTEMIGQLRDIVFSEPAEGEEEHVGISSLSDALYNQITDYVNEDPMLYRAQVQAGLAELEGLASVTDNEHEHTRYVMALYNVVVRLEELGIPHMPVWDRLYFYAMEHRVEDDMANNILYKETDLVNNPKDLKTAKLHHDRVAKIAEHPFYRYIDTTPVRLAIAKFNLLVSASGAGNMRLSEEMFADLMSMTEGFSEMGEETMREIVLRLAKGGYNMIMDYEDSGELAKAETIYKDMAPFLLVFSDDANIANRLVNSAFSLCIDLRNAGRADRIREIYAEVKDANADGEAAERLYKLKNMAGF